MVAARRGQSVRLGARRRTDDGRTDGLTDGLAGSDGMRGGEAPLLLRLLTFSCLVRAGCAGNPDAKRLYDDLLSNYNKLVRPVVNVTDPLKVKIKLKLSQLIDVVSTRNTVMNDLGKSAYKCEINVRYDESEIKCFLTVSVLWLHALYRSFLKKYFFRVLALCNSQGITHFSP